jgi:hypothetical protein
LAFTAKWRSVTLLVEMTCEAAAFDANAAATRSEKMKAKRRI